MKKTLILLSLALSLVSQAQSIEHGLVGFATTSNYGVGGTYGGSLGSLVYAKNESELRQYCSASQAYVILFEGTISTTNEKDIQVASNKSIIGLNGNAVLDGIGFNANGVSNVIIRGFTIKNAHQDAIAFRSSHHVWIDHCDLSASDDGLLDFTIGSDLMTASWNRFHDHDKVSVCNSGTQHYEDVGKQRVSYHHNSFINTTQRNPRIGYGKGHVWNNYYEGITSYCVGYFTGAQVLVESNYFKSCKTPLQQMYSSDPTSAHYGQAQSKDNIFSACSGNTKGTGNVYNPATYYDASFCLDAAKDVPSIVKNGAGPRAGLEYDLIPIPNSGRIDYPSAKASLKWSPAPGAKSYKLYIDTIAENLKSVPCLAEINTNAFTTDSLQASTTYYWRVDIQLEDTLIQGQTWQFRTAAAGASKPYPANGESNAQLREQKDATNTQAMTITWAPAFGASGYLVHLKDDQGEIDYSIERTASQTSWQPKSLPRGRRYTWTVDALDANGNILQYGQEWTFKSSIATAVEGKNEAESWTRGLRAFIEVQDGSWFLASGKKVVGGESGPGTLNAQWKGETVNATISICMFDESDGKGIYKLFINDKQVGSISATTNNDKLVTYGLATCDLRNGDQIRIDFAPEGGEGCRTDYINIKVNHVIDALPWLEADSETPRYFDIFGRPVTPDDNFRGLLLDSQGNKVIVK